MLHTRNSSCITSLWLHLHHDCIFYVLSSKNILMKQVVYQQPTCVCVKMEFMVGTISLSCELYSFSWSCFRSHGSVTTVYEKWCFDLHVECCGSCMVNTIGVGEGKFVGGAKDFCPNFPKLARKVLGDFAYKSFPSKIMKTYFGMTSKSGLLVFFCKRWAPFYEIKQRWAPFLPGFSEILPRFSRIVREISTNQNF